MAKYKVLLGFTVSGEHRVYPGETVEASDIGDARDIRYKQDRGFISKEPIAASNGGDGKKKAEKAKDPDASGQGGLE